MTATTPRGPWASLRPRLDNPMTWSVPVGRLGGVRLRIHALLIAYVVIEVARAKLFPSAASTVAADLQLLGLGVFLLVAVSHELLRAAACRFAHGTVSEICFWPLGGLVPPRPRQDWLSHFVVFATPLIVGGVLFGLLAPILVGLTGLWTGVAYPPLLHGPDYANVVLIHHEGAQPFWLVVLFQIHRANALLLVLHLLPFLPLAGAHVGQALLWSRSSYVVAARLMNAAGLTTALAVGFAGAIVGSYPLIALAVIGGLTTRATWGRVEWTDEELGDAPMEVESLSSLESVLDASLLDPEDDLATFEPALADQELAAREVDAEQSVPDPLHDSAIEDVRIDRILSKISESGIESLSSQEREDLERATDRRRQADQSS